MDANPRILIVDDDDGFRYAAERMLRQAGYHVTVAPDHRDAINRINDGETFDLLLTDVVMPDRVNGFALARIARMRCRDIKVIYITAYDVPLNEAEGRVLRKPINDHDLVTEVRMVLAA
jgi:CheY-like chemotaxis protein